AGTSERGEGGAGSASYEEARRGHGRGFPEDGDVLPRREELAGSGRSESSLGRVGHGQQDRRAKASEPVPGPRPRRYDAPGDAQYARLLHGLERVSAPDE